MSRRFLSNGNEQILPQTSTNDWRTDLRNINSKGIDTIVNVQKNQSCELNISVVVAVLMIHNYLLLFCMVQYLCLFT